MITVGMYYDVVPGKGETFKQKFQEVIRALAGVPGHKVTHLYQRVEDPESFAILSEWETREAFADFIRSDTFRDVTAWGRAGILRSMPRHEVYPKPESLGRP